MLFLVLLQVAQLQLKEFSLVKQLVSTGGTLTVGVETSGAASSQFLTTGLSGVEMSRIKFAATVEDMKIDRLEVRTVNGDGNISQVKLLGTGLSTDPTAYIAMVSATFTFATVLKS